MNKTLDQWKHDAEYWELAFEQEVYEHLQTRQKLADLEARVKQSLDLLVDGVQEPYEYKHARK